MRKHITRGTGSKKDIAIPYWICYHWEGIRISMKNWSWSIDFLNRIHPNLASEPRPAQVNNVSKFQRLKWLWKSLDVCKVMEGRLQPKLGESTAPHSASKTMVILCVHWLLVALRVTVWWHLLILPTLSFNESSNFWFKCSCCLMLGSWNLSKQIVVASFNSSQKHTRRWSSSPRNDLVPGMDFKPNHSLYQIECTGISWICWRNPAKLKHDVIVCHYMSLI